MGPDFTNLGLDKYGNAIESSLAKNKNENLAIDFDITKDSRIISFKKIGKIITNSNTTTTTGALTFVNIDLHREDAATFTTNLTDSFTYTLTPLIKQSSLTNLLTSVSISSAVLESKINNSARDGTENQTTATWDNTVIQWGKNATPQTLNTGLTFLEVWLPKAATISSAYLFFTAKGTNSNTVNATIYGVKNTTSVQFSSSSLPSNATKTTASAAWNTTGQTDLAAVQSPNISTIVAEIANQTNWRSGDRMQLIILDNGSATGKFAEMGDYSFNATFARDPYLQINITITIPDDDLLFDFITTNDLAGISDVTGVRTFVQYIKNLARFADSTNDNIRRYILNYSITAAAYSINNFIS